MIVYGSNVSYFTGKFESYLRFREIGYEYRPLDLKLYRSVVPEKLGATQYPSVDLQDGRWMSDTTPMIAWLEKDRPGPSVIPSDPVQRYLSLLVEDYADEWLWRPAMYYRWSYAPDRYLASTRLAEEIIRLVPRWAPPSDDQPSTSPHSRVRRSPAISPGKPPRMPTIS